MVAMFCGGLVVLLLMWGQLQWWRNADQDFITTSLRKTPPPHLWSLEKGQNDMEPKVVLETATVSEYKAVFLGSESRRDSVEQLGSGGFVSKPQLLNVCEMPAGGFKAWKQGTVTRLTPHLAVNCSAVLSGDKEQIRDTRELMSDWRSGLSDWELLKQVGNCAWLKTYLSIHHLYNSQLEQAFPIAFTLVVHDSPQQVLRLLRMLYRPQNAYCIHYDIKSTYKHFFQSIARCFENVMVASRVEDIVWGHYTIMQAQMNCLDDLLQYRLQNSHPKWQYVINLCGKELPLVTNREMVQRLMKLNGSSSIVAESCATKKRIIDRIEHPVELNINKTGILVRRDRWLQDRPFNLTQFHKSSSYNALSFQFANYISFNKYAKQVYDFFKQARNSEEHFYATLFKTPGVPGGFNRHLPSKFYFEVAGSFWTKVNSFQRGKKYACRGKVVHEVCVVSAGDLKDVMRGRGNHLFHNKYFMEYDHSVMTCAEEVLVRLNQQEFKQECGS